MKKRKKLKVALATATLASLGALFHSDALLAQDNIWVNGSQLLDFNNPAGQIPVTGLPTGGTTRELLPNTHRTRNMTRMATCSSSRSMGTSMTGKAI